ncbi:uncharacterized protein LOC8274922 [Ricinus communis]|uniref:uncharacterized protein LOC8274922 n=1 Tax=Ricinus communis TaxID=3988 RepID=UPI00201B2E09|nr:uncharacterized protein LOC8274922 [Ricinus communis]
MFDLEESLTVESYRIPWLIWIQILIFILLLFLFYCFSVFTSSDLSLNTTTSSNNSSSISSFPPPSSSSSTSASSLNKATGLNKHNSNTTTVTNLLQQHHNQIGGSQSIKGEIATSTSRTVVREGNVIEGEGFSTNSVIDFHPCNYFRLAKLAFLKCLGLDLDPVSERCSSSERKKER